MGLQQLNFDTETKEETAIGLIQAFAPQQGIYRVADSGGKDSRVVVHLTMRSGKPYEAVYCVSPTDPPELRQFLKDECPNTRWEYHARGWWKMVAKRGLPRRQAKWCCEYIKEAGGEKGDTVITGVRAWEGRKGGKRSKQGCFGDFKGKHMVRPIFGWLDSEVWEYIRKYNLPYCKLYDIGAERKGYGDGVFTRIGCVGCPAASHKKRIYELNAYPKIAMAWRNSCDRIVERKLAKGDDSYKTGEELWQWFLSI